MKNYITILFLLAFTSVSAQNGIDKNTLVGIWKYECGWFGYTLVLNEDNTYTYRIAGDMLDMNNEGVWRVEKCG